MPSPPYSNRTGSLHASSPFYKHGLTLIPAWISDHILSKVWDEIIYPFSNFNDCTVEVGEWISNFIPHFIFRNGCDYLSMLGSKLNQISKRGPGSSAAMYWVCGINRSLLSTMKGFSQSLPWRHNEHDGVSNHQPHDCLLNRLFRYRSKKTSNLRVTGLCGGNSPGPVNSLHKGPVTRKMFPFDDVIMYCNPGDQK